MGNTKAVSNEEIISALILNGTVKDAASAVQISPRTIYDRMNDKDFRAQYMWAKTEIIRKSVFIMQERLCDAIEAVAEIMGDSGNPPTVRLQAAQLIIRNAERFTDMLNRAEFASRTENKSIMDIEL